LSDESCKNFLPVFLNSCFTGRNAMNEPDETPTAAVVIIGNEILSGRTREINLNAIARKLLPLGIPVVEARVVRDDEEAIVRAVNSLRALYTYVFTTGGIGPTHDDITAAAIARAFNLPLVRHPGAKEILKSYYAEKDLNPERLGMAEMPEGAELIENPVSVVPGFRISNVFVLAGVPEVVRAMMDSISHRLKHGPLIHSITIACNLTEGVIAGELAAIAGKFPGVETGSYPAIRLGKIGAAIVLRGTDAGEVAAAAGAVKDMIVRHGGTPEIEAPGHKTEED